METPLDTVDETHASTKQWSYKCEDVGITNVHHENFHNHVLQKQRHVNFQFTYFTECKPGLFSAWYWFFLFLDSRQFLILKPAQQNLTEWSSFHCGSTFLLFSRMTIITEHFLAYYIWIEFRQLVPSTANHGSIDTVTATVH